MGLPSLHVPISFAVKKREDVTRKILEIQALEGGRVTILSVNYLQDKKEWVVFYYPIKSFGIGNT